MSNEIDTNIYNYTNNELLEILGFENNIKPSKHEITIKIDKIINKYSTDNNELFTTFFTDTKNKLLNNKTTPRENQIQLLNQNSKPVMNKEYLHINNTIPLEIGQDTLNPTLRQVISKFITIDSKYRPNILPYSANPISKTSSTNFLCTLSEKVKNTVSLKLNSIFLPRTWYTFDNNIKNISFVVYNSINQNNSTTIYITEGNYTPEKIVTEINYKILQYPDISGLNISLATNTSTPIIHFKNFNISNTYKIIFYSNDISLNEINNNKKYDQNLGYNLGFRTLDKDNNLSINLDPVVGIAIAEAPIDVNGPQYLTLIIDDFNYNYTNNGGITIEKTQSKMELPGYFNKLSQDKKTDIFVPLFPRKLTQAQLYAVNEIIAHRKEPDNKTTSQSNSKNSNIFAVIYLPNISDQSQALSISYSGLSKESLNERKYFGPVCIEKLKISLYDDKGNLVNLHGHNWSFTLIADELYQY